MSTSAVGTAETIIEQCVGNSVSLSLFFLEDCSRPSQITLKTGVAYRAFLLGIKLNIYGFLNVFGLGEKNLWTLVEHSSRKRHDKFYPKLIETRWDILKTRLALFKEDGACSVNCRRALECRDKSPTLYLVGDT